MLGILIPEFPTQTHIFFWREIDELRRQGIPVRLISTRRPLESACRHAFAPAARAETHYVFPPRWGTVARTLLARPRATARALGYLVALRETPWARRVRSLGLLACAAELLAHARAEGIRHVHAHSCADAAHVVALCRILGGPSYSLTLHGDLPVYGTDHAAKMAGAACVTCAGPHLKPQIVERVGYPAERVMPNWMGFDVDRFRSVGRRRDAADALHLVTVARLDACKGHRFALAAMRAAVDAGVDVRYTLVGDGVDRESIAAEVGRLGLTDRVRFTGTCSEAQVLDVLQEADAFVLPSVGLGEAYGVATAEAMACSLPAICSDVGSVGVLVRDGIEGFLTRPADVDGLTQAMLRLGRDPALRRAMGERARARIAEMFHVRETVARTVGFIEASAGIRLRPPAVRPQPRADDRPATPGGYARAADAVLT